MKNSTSTQIVDFIKQSKAIPVFYHKDWQVCEQVVRICYQNGFKAFEFTNRGANAADLFEKLKQLAATEMPDMVLGAGTIFTLADVEKFTSIGADFIVSPILNPEVGQYCVKNEKLWIPGCMTVTEIFQAHTAGAQIIKLFPGDILGASFLRNIRPVFPTVNFMPTGGVTTGEDNLREWFDAGVVAVGMGSQLLSKPLIEKGDWEALNEHVRLAAQTIGKITLNK
mgnify:FL=1